MGSGGSPHLWADPPQPVDAAPLEMMPPEEESLAGGGEGDSGLVLLQALKSGSTRKVRHGGGVRCVGAGWQNAQWMLHGAGYPWSMGMVQVHPGHQTVLGV